MSSARAQLPALHRGFVVLEAVARSGQALGFSQLSEVLGGEAPSTVSRLLSALLEAGLLVQDGERRYAAGPRLQALGRLLAGAPPLADVVRPELCRLAQATGESAACFRRTDDGAELVAKHELDERFRYMAVGGVNRDRERHGFARLLAWTGPDAAPAVLVNRRDDQAGLLRICAMPVDGVAIGITCLAAGCDAARDHLLATAVAASARRLAPLLEHA